jgi:hypothetical protein
MNKTEGMSASGIDLVAGSEVHIDLSHKQLANGIQVSFDRMSPDASPGQNKLIISGLPAGTKGITAWITEWLDGQPHAGGAWFTTTSVQLYDNGTKCRVLFSSSFNKHLPAAAQLIFGPSSN